MASTVFSSRRFFRPLIVGASWCMWSSPRACPSSMRWLHSGARFGGSVRRWPLRSAGSGHRSCVLHRLIRMGVAMSDTSIAPMRTWLAAPMGHDVSEALERLRHAPDVQRIAVMPDVHLAADVCIGVVVATSHLIYPQAVGGDIGCGMLAVALDLDSTALDAPKAAGQILAELGHAVPARRRNRRMIIRQPEGVANDRLSHPALESVRRREGETE